MFAKEFSKGLRVVRSVVVVVIVVVAIVVVFVVNCYTVGNRSRWFCL